MGRNKSYNKINTKLVSFNSLGGFFWTECRRPGVGLCHPILHDGRIFSHKRSAWVPVRLPVRCPSPNFDNVPLQILRLDRHTIYNKWVRSLGAAILIIHARILIRFSLFRIPRIRNCRLLKVRTKIILPTLHKILFLHQWDLSGLRDFIFTRVLQEVALLKIF